MKDGLPDDADVVSGAMPRLHSRMHRWRFHRVHEEPTAGGGEACPYARHHHYDLQDPRHVAPRGLQEGLAWRWRGTFSYEIPMLESQIVCNRALTMAISCRCRIDVA